MIGDSVPWKDDLLRIADTIERRTTQRRWTERTSFLVERDVMVAAYAIRKLLEARELSDEVSAEPVHARLHRLTGTPVDIWNRYEFYEQYEMESTPTIQLTLHAFCNQVIHSWVWMLSATEEAPHRFDGLYVSSDRASKRHVYFFAAKTLVDLFREVGQDDVVDMRMQRDSDGIMHIIKASREHPAQSC